MRHSHSQSIFILVGTIIVLALCLYSCEPARASEGLATYYSTASCKSEGNSGVWTASGERFNEQAMTCALRRRDFGGRYIVYGHKTGRSAVVKHNDFGPGKGPQKRDIIIDLSPAAFLEVCGNLKLGKCEVSVQKIV